MAVDLRPGLTAAVAFGVSVAITLFEYLPFSAFLCSLATAFAFYGVFFVPSDHFHIGFNACPIPGGKVDSFENVMHDGASKKEVKFSSGKKEVCVGDLYAPNVHECGKYLKDGKLAAIAMAHGLGCTRDMGLTRFAQQFVNEGILVLVFDYRHFGQSTGQPRNLIVPKQLVDDYKSAVEYLQSLEIVDSKRVCVWGTSYAGGHVLQCAAEYPQLQLRCVIAQMPYVGAMKTESKLAELRKRGVRQSLMGLYGAICGTLLHLIPGYPEVYAGLYGHRGDDKYAINVWEDLGEDESKWLAKHLKERPNDWRNGFAIRGLFAMLKYRPMASLHKIDGSATKVLLVAASKDNLCPRWRIFRAAQLIAESETFNVISDHFSVYLDGPFQELVEKYNIFFEQNLL